MSDRKLKQDVFVRICKDSNFHMDYVEVAHLAAKMLKCSPLEIWMAFSSLGQMEEIALGKHPVTKS